MFGGSSQQTTGVSDLLLGAGGFASSSLGNGFSNDATLSATAAGGSSSGTTTTSVSSNSAFDLNDFPSLGVGLGGGSAASSTGGHSESTAAAANASGSNGLAAALRQQQQLLAHQQMQKQQQIQQQNNLYRLAMQGGSNGGNFNMATEDFPALPGAPLPSNSGAGNGNAGSGSSVTQSLLLGGSNAVNVAQGAFGGTPSRSTAGANTSGGLYGSDLDTSGQIGGSSGGTQLEGAGLLGGNGFGGLGGLQQRSASNPSPQLTMQTSRGTSSVVGASSGATSGGSGSTTGAALSGDYGLLGLLGVVRMSDEDRNALALGSDLTMLGLNLGSSEHIYNTFTGPWSESSGKTKEPHYQVRLCVDAGLTDGRCVSPRNSLSD
jgi:hypothetical protein